MVSPRRYFPISTEPTPKTGLSNAAAYAAAKLPRGEQATSGVIPHRRDEIGSVAASICNRRTDPQQRLGARGDRPCIKAAPCIKSDLKSPRARGGVKRRDWGRNDRAGMGQPVPGEGVCDLAKARR